MSAFARHLRALRLAKGLTAEGLARKTGLCRATIYRLEQPGFRRYPRSETLTALAKVLGVSFEDLLEAEVNAPTIVAPVPNGAPWKCPWCKLIYAPGTPWCPCEQGK
jgi:transcriptional regulator with XRE-family HTH domain